MPPKTKKPTQLVQFHRPDIDADDRAAIKRVLSSRWLTTGKEARSFEAEFASYVRATSAVALSSCTAALHVALELANVKHRRVIVPSLTFTATAAAVQMAGGTPVFADVDADTLTLSPKTVAGAIAETNADDVAAIIPVHYGGNPSGLREVLQYARRFDMRVIDDAAHALPATVDGRRIGNPEIGCYATCFSFYPTKPITTGEGGMLTLEDPALEARARKLSLHGISEDAYQRSRGGLYHYEVDDVGWKYNLPDILAALGRSQLTKADIYHSRRRRIASEYAAALAPLVTRGLLRLPVVDDGCESAWHLYVVRFNAERFAAGWDRDRVAVELKARGVATSMHYRPLHLHPYWRPVIGERRLPNTEAAYAEILSLPIWPGMVVEQVRLVARVVGAVCKDAMR